MKSNKHALNRYIKHKGLKLNEVAKALDLTQKGFWAKTTNNYWTVKETCLLAQVLDTTVFDIMELIYDNQEFVNSKIENNFEPNFK